MPYYVAGGNKPEWRENFQVLNNSLKVFVESEADEFKYDKNDKYPDRFYPGQVLVSDDALAIEERVAGSGHIYVLTEDFSKATLVQPGLHAFQFDIDSPAEAALSEQLQKSIVCATRQFQGLKLLQFYRGERPGPRGAKIEDIWSFNPMELESRHDFIQWIFPTTEPSRFNPTAPILSADAIREFQFSRDLQTRFSRSLQMMLAFFAIGRDEHGFVPLKPSAQLHWVKPGNHNFLRMTRILESLLAVGKEDDALSLFRCLRAIYFDNQGIIDRGTFVFWEEALLKVVKVYGRGTQE